MWKLLALFLLGIVASSQAIWLYTANGYNLDYKLYAIDTETYNVYTIGTIMDASGDKFTVGGMVYNNNTGLLYATGISRTTNVAKRYGLLAIDPLTAQVVWSTNCSTAPNPRFATISFDSTRRQYVLVGSTNTGPGVAYILSEADMHAGNCSAVQERWPDSFYGYSLGGADYIPGMDSLLLHIAFDGTNNYGPLQIYNMSSPSVSSTIVNSRNWWYDVDISGDFFFQSNGSMWAMGQAWGPGVSILYQLELGNNLTVIQDGTMMKGFGIRTIIPRAVRALSDGPVPTTQNKWRTGISGSIAFVTPDNDLFELNIETPAIRNITRLSSTVLAMESFGSWNQIYAIVNGTSGASLVHVNITNGALTTMAALPGRFQSLSMGADGKILALNRLANDGNVSIVQVSSNGSVSELRQFQCLNNACDKVWSDGTFFYFAPPTADPFSKLNITAETISLTQDTNFIDYCPDIENGGLGLYDCGSLSYSQFNWDRMMDMSFHAPSGGMLVAMSYMQKFTSLYRYNVSAGRALPVIDFHHVVSDMAYFRYDAAWCSNRGTWDGEKCVCSNAGIVGARCETVLPAPVAPPVNPPVAPPVNAPVASPVAVPVGSSPVAVPVGASPVAASTAPKATSAAHGVLRGIEAVLFCSAAVLSLLVL